MNVMLTGGSGYIGSHTSVVLAEAGHSVVLFDNLSNSKGSAIDGVSAILGRAPAFVQGDIRDRELLVRTMAAHSIDAVIHLAGFKSVAESVGAPLNYYENNVLGSLCLLQAMEVVGVSRLVFSSSATVYGEPRYLPIDEHHPTLPSNPYGSSKLHVERILTDLAAASTSWRIASLRYFNPVGAHESGCIGEDPRGIPNNLMPHIARVATGSLSHLDIFGCDYPTVDGTGVRDYIHVMDLAEGHLAALQHLDDQPVFHEIYNLGTGVGTSVNELVEAFELVSGRKVRCNYVGRRAGDVAQVYASARKAEQCLGWTARRGLNEMCESAWRYYSGRA